MTTIGINEAIICKMLNTKVLSTYNKIKYMVLVIIINSCLYLTSLEQ